MAKELMSLLASNGDELFGYKWIAKNATHNLVIVTGMEEYAARYDDFALFMNDNGFNVYCIDHYGQGENSKDGKLGIAPHSAFSKMVKNVDDLLEIEHQVVGIGLVMILPHIFINAPFETFLVAVGCPLDNCLQILLTLRIAVQVVSSHQHAFSRQL